MNIFKKGAFSYDPNMTPQQLADKRAMLAMLQPKYGKASYIGEGLGQLATGVATGIRTRKLDEIEGKGREQGANLFSGLFGGTTQSTSGQSGPMNILGVDPGYGDPNDPVNIAGDTMTALGKDQGTAGYRASLIGTESGGNWGAQNNEMGAGGKRGHYGRVQFGQARLQEAMDAGAIPQGTTPEQFMASPALQIAAENWHFGDLEKQLAPYVGAVVNGQTMDLGALVAMGHLGGAAGAKRFVESGGKYNPSDAYGTSLLDYARTHGGQLGGPVAAPAGASTATNSAMPSIDPQALAAALANPWLSPEERSVLTTIYDQQVQAGDPLRQIEVAKGMAELEKMNAPPAPPEDFTTRIFLAQQAGLEPGSEAFQTYLLTGKLPDEVGSNVPAAFASLDLQAKAAGFEPGTPEYQEFMRNGGGSGTPAAFTALDLQAKAAGFEPGTPQYQEFMATRGAGFIAAAKAKGEDAATAESLESKMPGLEEVVRKLDELSEKATYTYGGQALDWSQKQLGMDPRAAAVARSEYIAMVDNQVLPLLRDTFGAQFTQAEGETLRNTLGDPDKSPTEKQAVLKAFIEQKRRDIEALNVRTGRDAAPAAGGGTTRKRYNPATGAFE